MSVSDLNATSVLAVWELCGEYEAEIEKGFELNVLATGQDNVGGQETNVQLNENLFTNWPMVTRDWVRTDKSFEERMVYEVCPYTKVLLRKLDWQMYFSTGV